MSAFGDALLADLADDQLRVLADRLRPYLETARALATPDDSWLDGIERIAEYLGCPVSRLYDPRYRRESGVPLYKVGRGWAAKKSELDQWRRGAINSNQGGPS